MGTTIEMRESSDSHKANDDVAAIRNEKRELEKKVDNIIRKLSDYDRKAIDELLESKNY